MTEPRGKRLDVAELAVRTKRGRVLLSVPRLSLAPGASLGIRGPSGAGKSTLLFALAGLLDRIEGSVIWDGIDLAALRPSARAAFRASHMGIVFQDFLLFEELDAAANAALPALYRPRAERGAIRARAHAVLARLGVSTEARTVTTLSGGERQRVAVARALANDAAILLADEPTANLHREAADALIEDLVARVRESGTTLVVVSHDTRLLARMDRVIDIRDGGMHHQRLAG